MKIITDNFRVLLSKIISSVMPVPKFWHVAAFVSILMLPLFSLCSFLSDLGSAHAQNQEFGITDDPAFVEEQKLLQQGFKDLVSEFEAFERELADVPDPEIAEAEETTDDPQQLAMNIQTILASAGCYTIKVDGKWGPGSRGAVADFARQTGLSLNGEEPTSELAARLRENYTQGRICPLTCDARHELKGEACVLKTCAKGQTLNKNGACVSATPVRYGSVCTMGTKVPENPLDCHFLGSMIQDFKQQGKPTKHLIDEYNCTCRGRSG